MRRFLVLLLAAMVSTTAASSQIIYPRPRIYGPRFPRAPRPRKAKDPKYRGDTAVNRTVRDLRNLRSYPQFDKKHRKYAENAISELNKFEEKRYKGKWDDKRLDKALRDLDAIVSTRLLTEPDRDRLSADVRDLREFRAHRG